ncbi:MAG TPA: sigma-70 family RNA polymerase sigma factor [Gammaproteobacteria bacterium]|nr:sigma-70 family RNA polymerase sigma factor [Gammaproteobacteria bacterium]
MAIEDTLDERRAGVVDPVTETDDGANLLSRIAAGNEAALTRFYRDYHGRVYAFALRRLGNPTDAAEVVNEVMMEVWRHAHRYEGRAKVQTWLLGICHHKVIDLMRRRGRHAGEALEEDLPDPQETSAVDALAGAQDAQMVRRCLDELSDAHRQVVHLAFFEELSYSEIATIVACPEGTVKTRMFHAKQKLKHCLAGLAAD